MIQAGKRKKEFADPYTVTGAVTKGNIITKLSLLIMGLGNIAHRQIAKGLMFLVVEIGYIWFMIQSGIYNLSMFPSLGWREQEKVWNEKKSIYEYTAGDQSSLILLYGVATIYITLMFIVVWREAVKSSYKSEVLAKSGKHLNTFKEDFKSLFDQNLHKLLLAAPIMGVLIFTILPLIYNISMAFTNYSKVNDHLVLFDWVGLANFAKILNLNDSVGKQFYSVLTWTITWAIFATALNYDPKNIYEIAFKSIDLLFEARSQEALHASDLVVDLEVSEASVFDVKKVDYCYNAGYITMLTKINEVKKMLNE